MTYACKILADSISPAGHRITSFEATFPRIVLAEANTHCMLSRNSASSRARPVASVIAALKEHSFTPESFGRNQKGMQPGEALGEDEAIQASDSWNRAKWAMIKEAEFQASLGVHKQYANRLLETFSFHTAVITATDLDNFFHLRVNPLAQGEIQKIAQMMQTARDESKPRSLGYSGWHLPYVEPDEEHDLIASGLEPAKISVARCARVSYLTQNGIRDPLEDVKMYDERLLPSGHMSPFEHAARPMNPTELRMTEAWDVAFGDGPTLRVRWKSAPTVGEEVVLGSGQRTTVSYVRGPLHYSAKLNGWFSRRAFVRGEHDMLGAKT